MAAEPLTAHEPVRNVWSLEAGGEPPVEPRVVVIVARGGVSFAQKVVNVLRCPDPHHVAGVLVLNNDEAHPAATLPMAASALSALVGAEDATGASLTTTGDAATGTTSTDKPAPDESDLYSSPVPVAMLSFADGSRLLEELRTAHDKGCEIHLVPTADSVEFQKVQGR